MPLKFAMDTTQKVLVTALPVDANGVEVKASEPVVYAIVSGTCTLAPNSPDDGVSQFVISGSVAETCEISVTDATGLVKDSFTAEVSLAVQPAVGFTESAAAPVAK
jgi:hypothetical protein